MGGDVPHKHAAHVWLDPQNNYGMKIWVVTTVMNVGLALFAMSVNVVKASAGNSFSKNPEDWNTGDSHVSSKLVSDDEGNARWARIHNNLLENIPITTALAFIMLLCQPSTGAVNAFM